MSTTHSDVNSLGKITFGISQQTLALKIIDFVCQKLPVWRDDPTRPDAQSEPMLNSQLCKFLDSQARNDFPMIRFDAEEPQVSNRKVDLSVSPAEAAVIGAKEYSIYDTILVLECKRLPAPSKDREREYVSGGKERISGGIQRFKMGLHGTDMKLAAIIGYVQQRSANEWWREINKWILEFSKNKKTDSCIWKSEETLQLLKEDASKGLYSYKSNHGRVGKARQKIKIHHLWVTMN